MATKVGLEWSGNGDVRRNSSPARIEQEIGDSLRRLALWGARPPEPLEEVLGWSLDAVTLFGLFLTPVFFVVLRGGGKGCTSFVVRFLTSPREPSVGSRQMAFQAHAETASSRNASAVR
jgi:hypothetical protein